MEFTKTKLVLLTLLFAHLPSVYSTSENKIENKKNEKTTEINTVKDIQETDSDNVESLSIWKKMAAALGIASSLGFIATSNKSSSTPISTSSASNLNATNPTNKTSTLSTDKSDLVLAQSIEIKKKDELHDIMISEEWEKIKEFLLQKKQSEKKFNDYIENFEHNQDDKSSLLHIASLSTYRKNKKSVTKPFLNFCEEEGIKLPLNKQDSSGMTALHIAAMSGDSIGAKALLDKKEVDANIKNKHNLCSIHYAVKSPISTNEEQIGLLHNILIHTNIKVLNSKVEVLKQNEKHQVTLHQGDSGYYLMHLASLIPNEKILRYLLDNTLEKVTFRYQLKKTTKRGFTPLVLATIVFCSIYNSLDEASKEKYNNLTTDEEVQNASKILNKLKSFEKGIDILIHHEPKAVKKGAINKNPLSIATIHNNYIMFKKFLDAGAKIDILIEFKIYRDTGDEGKKKVEVINENILQYVVKQDLLTSNYEKKDRLKIVELLVENNVPVRLDKKMNSPLHSAAISNEPDIIKALLKHNGISTPQKSKKSKLDALLEAIRHDSKDAVEVIINHDKQTLIENKKKRFYAKKSISDYKAAVDDNEIIITSLKLDRQNRNPENAGKKVIQKEIKKLLNDFVNNNHVK